MEFLWDLFHRIYDVESLVRVGGLAGLAAIVFIETGLLVGFFLPGDSLLVTAGLFAARGDLNVVYLILVLSLAAIVGDTVGYNIGARTGPKLFSRPDSLLFNRKHLISTREFYERHGPFPASWKLESPALPVDPLVAVRKPERQLERRIPERAGKRVASAARPRRLELHDEVAHRPANRPRHG